MRIVPSAMKTVVALAIGASSLAATTAAHAVVVLTPVNINVPATFDGVYVNVLSGVSGLTPGAVPGWDINPWSATGLGFSSPAAPGGGAYVLSATATAANLAVGATVGPANTFGTGSSINVAQWTLNSSNNFFGFRFVNEGTGVTHYGFAQLSIGSTITNRTIIALAYDNVANTALTVTAIPEPGTYGLMALGLAAVALAARRRKQA